jgi:hypothetical protein
MRRAWQRLRAGWRALLRAQDLDRTMHEEMRFHIDMEADRLARERGLDAAEARRQAFVAFGGLEKYKAQGRDTMGLQWIEMVSLDARLGLRMLVKYRGLTVVGGCAMAVAVAIAATAFQAFGEALDPALPFDEGDRVVALRYATHTPGGSERRVLREFAEWRDAITSIESLGAFRPAQHNLVTTTSTEPVNVAEITASGFAVARTPPLMGRHLIPDDEHAGAPSVLVIGYRAWQSRFGADPDIVGRAVTLGGTPTTVVGVMPDGFRFPIDHQYWVPLRVRPQQDTRRQGPGIFMFGRLAPGVTLEQAQAEATAIGQRVAAAFPGTRGRFRLMVHPYTHEHLGINEPVRFWMLRIAQHFVAVLAFVVAVNLAILTYARTVTRLGEIALRTALGASRGRILLQLFIEALALAAVGAGGGLVLAHGALTRMGALALTDGTVPFWIDLRLSTATVLFAIALAVLAAVVMGVLPGLRATSGRVLTNLRELDGRTGGRLGPLWTTLVVAQVAVAVALLPMAVAMTSRVVQMGLAPSEPAAGQLGIGVVAVGDDAAGVDAARVSRRQIDLAARLESEPGVSAVAFSSGVPGFSPGLLLRFDSATPAVKHPGIDMAVDALDVSLTLFDAYDARILAGRGSALPISGAAPSSSTALSCGRSWSPRPRRTLGWAYDSVTCRLTSDQAHGRTRRIKSSASSATSQAFRASRARTDPRRPSTIRRCRETSIHSCSRCDSREAFRRISPAASAPSPPRSIPHCRCGAWRRSRTTTINGGRSGAISRGASACPPSASCCCRPPACTR